MKRLFLVLALAGALPTVAIAQSARVFDIVPPPGREVTQVDGQTVLRQPGTKYGAVLTFMPDTHVTAWIPVAVLNTSGERLAVGTDGVSARYGDTPLKVWSTTGLVRLAKERRGGVLTPPPAVAAPAAAAAPAPALDETARASIAPQAPAQPVVGVLDPGVQRQQLAGTNARAKRGNDEERARQDAAAQLDAFRDGLFRNQKLDPRGVGRGDVRIDLPPPRTDGHPTEFVLTLDFGGETMDVLYRERIAGADGDAAAPN